MARMLATHDDFQIAFVVVRLVVISVVHHFTRKQEPAKAVLGDDAVQRVQPLRVAFWMRRIGPRILVPATLARRCDLEEHFATTLSEGIEPSFLASETSALSAGRREQDNVLTRIRTLNAASVALSDIRFTMRTKAHAPGGTRTRDQPLRRRLL